MIQYNRYMNRIPKLVLVVLFFILLFSATATTSIDFTQDLGRHLKLGEIIIHTGRIPSTNLFSYTYPQFSFINHHWLSEVIFYVLYHNIHPFSLIVLKTLFVLAAFFFVIQTARNKSNIVSAILSTLVYFPLFLDRNYIRPELFGYLFYAIFIYFLVVRKRLNVYFFIIPFILLWWVNMHISFIFGIVIGCCICISMYIDLVKRGKPIKKLLIFASSFLIVCINPHGIKGALYPFNIFGNYGYPIVENQNIFFLSERISNQLISYFFIISPIIVVTIIFLFSRKKILEGLLLAGMFFISILQIRHFPFLVLTAIPFTAWTCNSMFLYVKKIIKNQYFDRYYNFIILLLCFIIGFSSFFFFDNSYYKTFDIDKRFGFGYVEENEKEATDFILNHHLKENIFNNFDIGGYLAYRLYPTYRLFVDNRPEAYPSSFFQETYIRMQEDEKLQNDIFAKYHIQTIILGHPEQASWAQTFLSRIQEDKNWKLVFLNSHFIIFTRKTNLIDLRDNDSLMINRIEKENNYLNLLRLAGVLQILRKGDLAAISLAKAKKTGTESCAIKRLTVSELKNSVYFTQANEYMRSSFWCFSPFK